MDLRVALPAMVIIGSAVGLALPGGPLDAEPPAAGQFPGDEAAQPRLAAVRSSATPFDEGTVLARASDGHFYADVEVDGQPFRMLVDTGASVVALTGSDAEAMGLSWSEDEVAIVARGAGGPVAGVHATIPAMVLGQHEVAQVPAVIVPEGLDVSLLGQSFLGTIGSVRIDGNHMVLGS